MLKTYAALDSLRRYEAYGFSTEDGGKIGIKIDFHEDYANKHSAILWHQLMFEGSGKSHYACLGIQKYWLDDIIMGSMNTSKDAMSK